MKMVIRRNDVIMNLVQVKFNSLATVKYSYKHIIKLITKFNVLDINICNPESRNGNCVVTGSINILPFKG
jgi:hypothetical protein